MDFFEYKVTLHAAESFTDVVYFCSREGDCNQEVINSDQIAKIEDILNEGGQQGWELVQTVFGKAGMLVFWKRQRKPA